MTKEEIKEFTLKVSSSNNTGLVVVTYEIIVNYINCGKYAFENNNYEEFVFNINKSRQFIGELISSLDLQYKISHELLEIYRFINKSLISNIVRKDIENIDKIIVLIEKLRSSFDSIKNLDESGHSMENSQKIYAGLTYGKGTLNEYRVR